MILVGSNHRQTEKNLRPQCPTHRRKWIPSGAHDPAEGCVPPFSPVPWRRWRDITHGLGTSHLPRRECEYRAPVDLGFVLEKTHVCHVRRGFSVVVQVCGAALVRGSVAPWCVSLDRSLASPLRVLPL